MSNSLSEKKLTMSFDLHTIEHLGVKMYSQLPNAIAELVANSYDADSPDVHIVLTDNEQEKSITVIDRGIGMSFEEINEKFLLIGRNRREQESELSPYKQRKVTGRKGLGKLALFGIGNTIQITTKKDGKCIDFTMNWNEILGSKNNYEPSYSEKQCGKDESGTTVTLKDLKRKTGFNAEALARSIARLFNFFDDEFIADIRLNNNDPIIINKSLRYDEIEAQFTWDIPTDIVDNDNYFHDKRIVGELLSTEKPLKPGLRGVTLFAHGRMVNAPEFFEVGGESSHFYSYLTGWLNVDFVDEQEEDIISTDRQSLSWDLPLTMELQTHLKQLLLAVERDWRAKRKAERERNITEKTKVNLDKWYPTLTPTIKKDVEKIVTSVVENSELENEEQTEVLGALHELIPEYAEYHWRHLHETVKDVSIADYKKRDFYRAVIETIKRYESIVQEKAGYPKDNNDNLKDGQDLMFAVFGPILSVTSRYKKPNGDDFKPKTIESIEAGQKHMSAGVMSGFRNPLAHEEIIDLRDSDLFTENDCLDILSLLSHLFRRLDDAIKK